MAKEFYDLHERAIPIQLTGWEMDTIVLALEHTINTIDDNQYGRDVQNLVVELARQLETYMEGET
jgi:hypothetical protein